MKLKSWTVALIVAVILFGGIGLTMAFNMWRTTSSKMPAKYVSGDFAGQNNPGDIRGSYSFGDVQKAFDVPVEVLGKAFGVGHVADLAAFQCKELEALYANLPVENAEIGTDAVRLFVALYKALPYTPEESTALPNPAVSQLKSLGTLSEVQVAFLDRIKVDISGLKAEAAAPSSSSDEHAEEERLIKGKTTFGEVFQWGVKKEDLQVLFGGEVGAPGLTLRDFAGQKGIEFSTIKTKAQELVDAAK